MLLSSLNSVERMAAVKRSPSAGQRIRGLAALLLASTALPSVALAGGVLPTGGTVVKGSASIESGPSSVTVTQTSATGIVDWNTFSIGAGNAVRFDNGAGSTLSRVTGNVTSEIDGELTATGTLYLVNPAGVVVGPSGSVFTGGSFIASAHDISNDQYLKSGAIEFSGASDAEVINAGTITSANGDITIASAINWSSANTLTLDAYHDIALNAAITGRSGGLTLSSGHAISATGAIAVGTYQQTSGAFSQLAASLPSFSASDFQLASGTFLRATSGDGSTGNPYLLTDVYGLQGVGTYLSSSFSLTGDIDASGTANWNSGAGFNPIGSGSAYGATFNGNDHTITGLTINRGSASEVGLFGRIGSGALVENLRLESGTITGRAQTDRKSVV